MSTSKLLGLVFGVIFISVGIIGFIPNPLVSAEGLFITNGMHNFVHIFTGAVFLLVFMVPGRESRLILGIGIAYTLVAALGFVTSSDHLLGLIQINQADRWLHLFLAATILAAFQIGKQMDISRRLKTE